MVLSSYAVCGVNEVSRIRQRLTETAVLWGCTGRDVRHRCLPQTRNVKMLNQLYYQHLGCLHLPKTNLEMSFAWTWFILLYIPCLLRGSEKTMYISFPSTRQKITRAKYEIKMSKTLETNISSQFILPEAPCVWCDGSLAWLFNVNTRLKKYQVYCKFNSSNGNHCRVFLFVFFEARWWCWLASTAFPLSVRVTCCNMYPVNVDYSPIHVMMFNNVWQDGHYSIHRGEAV